MRITSFARHTLRAFAATAASVGMVGALLASPAMAAPVSLKLSKTTVTWGETIDVNVSNLKGNEGYYLLFCEAEPKDFAICVKNGKNPLSHRRISNNVTDEDAIRIAPNGTAAGKLQITKKDTTLTGPVPNPFQITCVAGCRVAVTYDHPTSSKKGDALVPQVLASTPITVK